MYEQDKYFNSIIILLFQFMDYQFQFFFSYNMILEQCQYYFSFTSLKYDCTESL